MLDVAAAQFRYTLSLLFGWRFSVRSLERMLAALRETQREFGTVGKQGSEVVDGPALDAASRHRIQLHRFRQQAKRAMRDTAYYHDLFARLELDPANLGYEDITRLPCTPKEAVRDDPDAFVSRQARPYLRATTTGTTGKPTSHSGYVAQPAGDRRPPAHRPAVAWDDLPGSSHAGTIPLLAPSPPARAHDVPLSSGGRLTSRANSRNASLNASLVT